MTTINDIQNIKDNNPWKGLNYYKEGDIIYGRDDEIQSLALFVINNMQTVLYGKSGIGKSSIIYAGIFPLARKKGLFPVPVRLKHDQDTSYIEQIKTAFKDSGIGVNEILPAICEQKESLWEYLHRNTFYEQISKALVRPLIVLDQFEEIFTLQHDENKKKAFFSELADLLNEVVPDYISVYQDNDDIENNGKGDNNDTNSTEFVLNLGLNETGYNNQYVSESLFRVVFTIREDFLSYLERYTKYIPVMKLNRYALLPLNEEQAKDIIMKPVEGLVDVDVAKLIIQKVTGKTDFNLGDSPEIDVDAAVLSLYLSRLYIKKGDNCSAITAALVDQSSKDIIKDFYEEAVSGLDENDVVKIEDQLLTYDGRRNNVSRYDLIQEGVSECAIDTLVEDRKLLRQFSYQDDLRVEYMHDILCSVVNDRIEHREQLAKERDARKEREKEAEERKKLEEKALELKKKNSRRKKIIGILAGFLVVAGVVIVILFNRQPINNSNQFLHVSLMEDSLVVADNDYWKAKLIVKARSDSSKSYVLDTLIDINKSIVAGTYDIPVDGADQFEIYIDYGDNSRYESVIEKYTIKDIIDKNNSISLRIKFAEKPLYTYESNIVMDFNGVCKNIQDAVVILRDKVQRTDENGHFCFNMEAQIPKDAVFYVVKDGFNVESFELSSDLKLRDKYTLTPSDSLSGFYQNVDKLVSFLDNSFNYRFDADVTYTDGTKDKDMLRFCGKYINKTKDGSYEIEGYYYYFSEYNNFERNSQGHLSYHFFKGKIDKSPKRDDDCRYFEVISTDIANNRQIIYGKLKEENGKRHYSGEIKTSSDMIGSFVSVR